jgi:molybdopterin-guanine dinucleotide biosynthesis protein A
MGTDKASVLLAGESCAERIGQLLRTVAAPVIEVGRGRTEFDVVTETLAGGGPLLALVAGYRHLTHLGHHGPILLLACDLPLVSKIVLSALAKWPGQGSVVPLVNGRAQPLCARWSVDDLERAEALVAGGDRSMRALLGAPTVTLVDPTSWDPVLGLARMSRSPWNLGPELRAEV